MVDYHISAKAVQFYFFRAGSPDLNVGWKALSQRFPRKDGWQHAITLGRFDFAVMRLTSRLYGSDFAMLRKSPIEGMEDVVEMAFFEWEKVGEGPRQNKDWKAGWKYPLLGLVFVTLKQPATLHGMALQEQIEAADEIAKALRNGNDMRVVPMVGMGAETFILRLHCKTFESLFKALEKAAARADGRQHVRAVVGFPMPRGNLSQSACGMQDVGRIKPTVALTMANGASPGALFADLCKLGQADRMASVGGFDYQLSFRKEIEAKKFLIGVLDARAKHKESLSILDTVANADWTLTESRGCMGARTNEDFDIPPTWPAAVSALEKLMVEADVPPLIEAGGVILDRGSTFLRNSATQHLTRDMQSFFRLLCGRIQCLVKDHVDVVKMNDEQFKAAKILRTQRVGNSTRKKFAARQRELKDIMYKSTRKRQQVTVAAIHFSRALRQRASGNYVHLFDANVQARADTHFGNYRRFISAASGIIRSIYRPISVSGASFGGFVLFGNENQLWTVDDIVHIPFHLFRRPEKLHIVAHEVGHQICQKLNFEREVELAASHLRPFVPQLAEIFLSDYRPAENEWERVSRMKEVMADIFWCAAVAPKWDNAWLNAIYDLIITLNEDNLYLNQDQVSALVDRIVCVSLVNQCINGKRKALTIEDLWEPEERLIEATEKHPALHLQVREILEVINKDKFRDLAEEAVLLCSVVQGINGCSGRISRALTALRGSGDNVIEKKIVGEVFESADVSRIDPTNVLGARMSKLFWDLSREKEKANLPKEPEQRVADLNRRFALCAVLEQL